MLLHVGMRTSSTANSDPNMIVAEVFLGQTSHVLVEGRGEEEIAVIPIFVGILGV